MADQPSDFYKQLRARMKEWFELGGKNNKWAEYLMAAPDLLHLLCKLTVDKDVQVKEKAKLAIAIAYFLSPLDLAPEAIVGPVGYADDIVLAAYVLNSIINNVDPAVVRRHWAGDADVLELIQQILKVADEMVGSGLWRKLRKMVD